MISGVTPLRRNVTIALALLLAVGCVLAIFWPSLVGDRTFLFRDCGSDSVNIAYPFYCQSSFYLHAYGVPTWSAHQGLGQAFSGLVFGDPFIWPIILQDGPVAIAKAIGGMEAFKCLLAILLFAAYLRTAGVGRLAGLLGSLSYGLSGYLILGSCWNGFTTEVVYLALLLLAMERYIQRGSLWLIPLPICLLGLLQPFYYWGFGLFTLAYLFLRRAELRAAGSTRPAAGTGAASARSRLLEAGRQLVPFGGMCAIGVLASGVFLLSSVDLMLQSPRGCGTASYAQSLLHQPVMQLASLSELLSALCRALSANMLGVGSGFTGWENYLEAPLFYCGLAMLLLIPQLFVMCDRSLRMLYGSVLALVLIPVLFPWIRHAFWLFQGDYYRLLSLFITTVFILLGVRVLVQLEAGGRLSLTVLAIALGLAMASLFILPAEPFVPCVLPDSDITIRVPASAAQGSLVINEPLRNQAAVLLPVYALILAAWSWLNGRLTQTGSKRPGSTRWCVFLAKGAFLTLTVLELVGFARDTLNDRPVVSKAGLQQKTGYNDYTVEALAGLRASDQTPFYRINKDYSSGPAMHISMNDAMVQRFYGSSCYAQFNQLHYIEFLDAVGVLNANNEHESRWCDGLTQRPLLQILAGTKYCLTKTPAPYRKQAEAYEEIGTWGDVTAFRYRQWLPLGLAYGQFVTREAFAALPTPAQKDAMLFRAAVVEPGELPGPGTLAPLDPLRDTLAADIPACVGRLRQSALTLEEFRPDRIRGRITLERSQLLTFAIPFDRGWTAVVDGHPARLLKVNIGFLGVMVPTGRHTVALQYRPTTLLPGVILSGCGLTAYVFLLVWRRRKGLCV